jgi:hypothetical protein
MGTQGSDPYGLNPSINPGVRVPKLTDILPSRWHSSGVMLHIVTLRLRMAISLGFHRKYYEKTYSPLEEEEGKRCWWLCYILEK